MDIGDLMGADDTDDFDCPMQEPGEIQIGIAWKCRYNFEGKFNFGLYSNFPPQ
jgi:hypothetical protein